MVESINLEKSTLETELIKVVDNILASLGVIELSNEDRCGDVCRILVENFPEDWEVQKVSSVFDDFSDLIDGGGNLVLLHVFLVASKDKKYFLVDPTFGQFDNSTPVFVHEITGDKKNQCLQKLQQKKLPQTVFSMYVNEIVKEKY